MFVYKRWCFFMFQTIHKINPQLWFIFYLHTVCYLIHQIDAKGIDDSLGR